MDIGAWSATVHKAAKSKLDWMTKHSTALHRVDFMTKLYNKIFLKGHQLIEDKKKSWAMYRIAAAAAAKLL